jgi:nucleoid-associated protein YgaU
MSAIGPFAIPILAVGAFAATLGWFGYQYVTRPVPAPAAAVATQPAKPGDNGKRADPAFQAEGGKSQQVANARPSDVAAAQRPAPEAAPPAFDVVRVEPTGETVIAGRATPGATVELVLNGVRHSRVVADPSGLFALVPEALPPGTHELSLQVANGDGVKARSQQSVTVVVATNRKDPPLVTITTPGQPTVVLSRPDGAATVADAKPVDGAKSEAQSGQAPSATPAKDAAKPAGEQPKPRRTVQIVSVETEGAGRLLVAGSAAPAAVVRLYLNETFIAPASAGPDGRLSFSIERGMQPGSYKVRLDDVDPVSGQVRSRAEVPFEMPVQVASAPRPETGARSDAGPERVAGSDSAGGTRLAAASPETSASDASPAVVVPEIATAIVSRGDSLWAISKRTYGQGLRYSVIYGANAKQIRDPNLIYPGQLFVLPVRDGEASAR